ncbi:MAG: hypothetical protein U1E53_01855 [Dongiaceae bacterium]
MPARSWPPPTRRPTLRRRWLDLAALWRGLQFYLQPRATALLLVVALLAGGWMLVRGRRPALLSALLSMALSLAYLVPKAILISYYLTSPAGFLLAAAVAPTALRHADWRRAARAAAVVLVGGAIWAGARHYPPADDSLAPAVRAALAEDPIVWTDEIGGRFVLEHGAYAAKLHFTPPPEQDRLVATAAAAGIPQLIAIDTDNMRELAARLGGTWRLTPLGEAYGAEVDRLEPKGR